MCFFVVSGTRSRVKTTDPEGVRARCPQCGVESRFVERQLVSDFTLYWIPLFPVQRGAKFVECQHCHAQFDMTLADLRARNAAAEQEQAEAAATRTAAAQRQQEEADRLRQAWMDHPEDRATLARLLDLLAEQGRYAEVRDLEEEVRARYGADPEILLRLAHAAFAQERYQEAIHDYEAVVAANPYRGDARYYLALSCWSRQPPDWDRALEQMQIASDMGYPAAVQALPKLKQARAEAR